MSSDFSDLVIFHLVSVTDLTHSIYHIYVMNWNTIIG